MARKRGPGAGRKPKGEFQGKSATLATRITPSTRAALERAAEKSGRSLSQEVEARLVLSIRKDRNRDQTTQIRALGEAIMLTAQCVERATESHWTEDAFTGEAVRQGAAFLISHFAPRGAQVTPKSVEAAAARGAGEAYCCPNSVGEIEAGRVISMIESWNFRSVEELEIARKMPGVHVPDEWYAHLQLFRELGSGLERARSTEKKRS
jgi:hypothetical protein